MPRKSKRGADLVGRAFRGPDGIVRWVHAQSTRGLLHLRWLDELSGVWFSGGTADPRTLGLETWPLRDEVPLAPKMGETFKLCGALGTTTTYRLTDAPILEIVR